MEQIKIKLLKDNAHLPTKGSKYAAAYDLYACLENEFTFIDPGETEIIPLGIASEIPVGWVGLVYPRSGLASKEDLTLANCVGVIDADYRGEWHAPIHHLIKDEEKQYKRKVSNGDRIAQVIFQKLDNYELVQVKELSGTERGEGGFGSTGKQ